MFSLIIKKGGAPGWVLRVSCILYISPFSFYRITIGNKSDERVKKQIDEVRIFHHEPGKFVFFIGIDEMPDNRKIEQLKLR